ncbi:hypothetical protein IW261DRAFT_83350 [Armillaria novae-zelandiae]|uniref:Uncharacterized protein n=1 Tax=Armillaria novae-zelandiae TaxID=153914 RepID=A0AA39UJ03_9AGAR|nr:hypothetical protein IW261DRAFT_83350 [Armillaria novae-zelandiae]
MTAVTRRGALYDGDDVAFPVIYKRVFPYRSFLMPPLPVPPPTAPVRLPLLPPAHAVLPAAGPWPPQDPFNLVSIPAFPLPSNEEYCPLGIEAYKLNVAPDIDNTSDRAQQVYNTRTVAIAKQLGSITDDQLAEMEADFQTWARDVQPSQSPHTSLAQLRCRMTWSVMVSKFRPKWPFSCHWDVDVVIKFAPIFIPFLLRVTPPRPGHTVIKARTLAGFASIFQHLIAILTRCPFTGKRKGLFILAEMQLASVFRDQTVTLTFRDKLDRFFDRKVYCGRPELQLIIEGALERSQNGVTRLVKINNICKIIVPFYLTTRPSSMGPSCQIYADRGFYLTLGDFEIEQEGLGDFTIMVHIHNHKGTMSTHAAMDLVFRLSSVTKAHNVLFDPTVWILTYLFSIQAFDIKYKTLGAFFKDPRKQRPIDKERKAEPFYRKLIQGGSTFMDPPQACTSNSISCTASALSEGVGIVRGGIYAWRRGAGNDYGVNYSNRVAMLIMNHGVKEGRVFDENYSLGVENHDMTEMRLQETCTTKKKAPPSVNAAILAIVEKFIVSDNAEDIIEAERQRKITRKEEFDKRRQDDPLFIAAEDALSIAWSAFFTCFTSSAARKYPRHVKGNVQGILDIVSGEKKHPQLKAGEPLIALVPNITYEMAKQRGNTVLEKLDARNAARVKNTKKTRRTLAQEKTAQFQSRAVPGTLDQHNKVKQVLEQPSMLLQPFLTDSSEIPDKDVAPLSDDMDFGEYEDPDYLKKLNSLINAKNPNTDVSTPLMDLVEQPPVEPADEAVNEADEPDHLQVPAAQVRMRVMEAIIAPITAARLLDSHKTEDGTYVCPDCPLFIHRPVPAGITNRGVFQTRYIYTRHRREMHSEWRDMELGMYIDGTSTKFKCPTCPNFKARTIARVQDHMLEECNARIDNFITYQEYLKVKSRSTKLDDAPDLKEGPARKKYKANKISLQTLLYSFDKQKASFYEVRNRLTALSPFFHTGTGMCSLAGRAA